MCEIYKALQDKEEIFFPLTEEQKRGIDSTVKTVNAEYFGFTRFATHEDKAAAYFVFIIKDHNLTDGNKRLAVFWTQVYSSAMNLKIDPPKNVTLDALAVAVEKMQIDDPKPLIDTIRIILFGK